MRWLVIPILALTVACGVTREDLDGLQADLDKSQAKNQETLAALVQAKAKVAELEAELKAMLDKIEEEKAFNVELANDLLNLRSLYLEERAKYRALVAARRAALRAGGQ